MSHNFIFRIILVVSFLSSLVFTPAAASPTPPPPAEITSPAVVRITLPDAASVRQLASILDTWESHPDQGYLVALVSPERYAALRQAGYTLAIDESRTIALYQPMLPLPGQTSGIPGYACYRTVEESYAAMDALVSAHPNLVSKVTIGQSWDKVRYLAGQGTKPGYDLFALVVTNQARPEPKPHFFLMAEIHARELTTAETALRFAEYLIQNYGVDPDITWLLDYYEVDIVPMTNPDGRKYAEQGNSWRKNTDNDDGCTIFPYYGTDLNRNSSFEWDVPGGASTSPCDETYRGPSAVSEPETQAIQNYVLTLLPDQRGPNLRDPAPPTTTGMFITMHSYGNDVLFPWGFEDSLAPNNIQLQTLGRKLGYYTNYAVYLSAFLYPASGATDDWAYGELGVPAYTIEMGTTFAQSCSSFESIIWPANRATLLYAFKAARQPYKDPAGPEVYALGVAPNPALDDSSLILTASASDTRYYSGGYGTEPSQAIAAAHYSIDKPSWDPSAVLQPMQAGDGSFDATPETLTAQVSTSGLMPGRHILFVEAQDAADNWGVPTTIFFTVNNYHPAFDPTSTGLQASAGQLVTYNLTVLNHGSAPDSFSLAAVSNHGWVVTAQSSLGPLASGASSPLSVSVQVPADISNLDSDQTILTLTSQADPRRTAQAVLTTNNSGIALTSDELTQSVQVNMEGQYFINLRNNGAGQASYTLSTSGGPWPITLPAGPIGPLNPGDNTTIVVKVSIPPHTPDGALDSFTLRVTNAADPTRYSELTFTTTALWLTIQLPFIVRASSPASGSG